MLPTTLPDHSVVCGGNRPGSTSSLTIRGAGDLSAIGVNAQSPLYVIDGFILDSEAFNNLDPNSIENISILKDAAAAVYGARAANGVVLVTTKKVRKVLRRSLIAVTSVSPTL